MTDPTPRTRAEARAAETPNAWIPRGDLRLWLYGIGVALAAVLIGYGIINAEQGDLWVALLAAILGTSNAVAARNVPRRTVDG